MMSVLGAGLLARGRRQQLLETYRAGRASWSSLGGAEPGHICLTSPEGWEEEEFT